MAPHATFWGVIMSRCLCIVADQQIFLLICATSFCANCCTVVQGCLNDTICRVATCLAVKTCSWIFAWTLLVQSWCIIVCDTAGSITHLSFDSMLVRKRLDCKGIRVVASHYCTNLFKRYMLTAIQQGHRLDMLLVDFLYAEQHVLWCSLSSTPRLASNNMNCAFPYLPWTHSCPCRRSSCQVTV